MGGEMSQESKASLVDPDLPLLDIQYSHVSIVLRQRVGKPTKVRKRGNICFIKSAGLLRVLV